MSRYIVGFKTENEANIFRAEIYKNYLGARYNPNSATKYLDDIIKHSQRDEWAATISPQAESSVPVDILADSKTKEELYADNWFKEIEYA